MSNQQKGYLEIKEASIWASQYLGKTVTTANISYLVNYGCISAQKDINGKILIPIKELDEYYKVNNIKSIDWQKKLGDDLNWDLSFDYLKEAQTTKHVHRLHPYKGKFIPQLVEYFIDEHTDKFKKDKYFSAGDIILDPFCGSGTTLVQANELGIDAIGIDISQFNALISNSKIAQYDIPALQKEIAHITDQLKQHIIDSGTAAFEKELSDELIIYNNHYFPVPEFKYNVRRGLIDGKSYGEQKAKEFLPIYNNLITKYQILLKQNRQNSFLDIWYTKNIRNEIEIINALINKIENRQIKAILQIILSRTMRSCRATTHADLGTLKDPVMTTYYCTKHGKICKPLFSIFKWWKTYCKDTVTRLQAFDKIRTNSLQYCLAGDSRNIDIIGQLEHINPELAKKVSKKKISGIFTSPPYVGLIDYHEQHAYSYDLFGFDRNDESEIGPLFRGQGYAAQKSYINGITGVLNHCKQFLADDYNIFIVANDKYGLYPHIAENAGMQIINQYKRPVLNRTEKDKGAYSEIIFHLKSK
ncbi:MAG: site-specific DNA-methyltransferase [Alistipes sp.]|nr:site-specific DNA-methyltransferase [Alistipes sp.]